MNLSFFLLLLNLTDLVAHRAVSDTFSGEGRDVFAVASDAYGDKLPSATGVAVFWKQLISPLFQFLGCLEAVLTLESSKKPLVFRTALQLSHRLSVSCWLFCAGARQGEYISIIYFFYFWGGGMFCLYNFLEDLGLIS